MASRAVLTLLLLSTLAAHLSAETCYLPNGSAIGGLRVCDPSAPASACCALGDECTTNGFCKAGNDGDNNWLWRGTCTDKTWESDSCPKYCYDSSTSMDTDWQFANVSANPLTGEIAAKVNFKVMACSEDSYCCSYPDGYYPLDRPGFDCCDDPKRNFTAGPADFQAGYPVTTKVFVGFASLSGSRAGTSTPKSSTSSSSTSTESEATTSPTSMLESQSNIGQLSTTLASPQTTISSTSSIPSTSSTSSTTDAAALTEHTNASVITDPTVPASPSADKESGMSTGASAGIGVGAGIAALALVGFGVFTGLRLRKRDSSARDGMSKELAGGPSIEQQERQPVYSHRDSRDVKSSVGIYEAGWQLPSEADSIPRGELEGDSVGFRR
jgi:hypothetical protein